MGGRASRVAAWVFGLALTGCIGCDEAPKPTIASASAAPAAPVLVHLRVEPYGSVVFTLSGAGDGGASAPTKGLVTAVSGELTVAPEDLTSLRGSIEVDLSKLTTHSFADEVRDAKETASVRAALDADKPGKLARFTIREVPKPLENNVLTLPYPTETLRLVGDLELHGVKVEERVELSATFVLRSGALAGINLSTPEPIPIKLSAHGLPGSADQTAMVTFEISAIAP